MRCQKETGRLDRWGMEAAGFAKGSQTPERWRNPERGKAKCARGCSLYRCTLHTYSQCQEFLTMASLVTRDYIIRKRASCARNFLLALISNIPHLSFVFYSVSSEVFYLFRDTFILFETIPFGKTNSKDIARDRIAPINRHPAPFSAHRQTYGL